MAKQTPINRSQIMQRAWALFRTHYDFPRTPFNSIGMPCFAECLKRAWAEIKEEANTVKLPQEKIDIRIAAIRHEIDMTKYLPFGMNQRQIVGKLENQISQLQRAA